MDIISLKKALEALEKSEKTESIAEEASSKSEETKSLVNAVQEQLNQAIQDGDSLEETQQARVDEKGNPHDTLKDRLDSEQQETDREIKLLNYQLVDNVIDIEDRGVNIRKYEHLKVPVSEGYDWSHALISALNDNLNVFIPPIKNMFLKDVELPSGSYLFGIEGKTVIRGFKKDDVGQYVETIFKCVDSEDITVKNIVFDGGVTTNSYTSTADRNKVKNMIYFKGCKNIHFEKCGFTRFISNPLSADARVGWEGYLWHLGVFHSCEDVYLIDCELYDTYLEGISGYNTKNFNVINFKTRNTYISTPLHAWFCDGFRLINPDIWEDMERDPRGSSLNIYSKNVVMQGGSIKGGDSLDLGNEAEDPDFKGFVAENISIKDINIKSPINSVGVNPKFHSIRNVEIIDCMIDATGFSRGINTGNCENVLIQGNRIIGAENAIRYSLNRVKNLKIRANTFKDVLRSIVFVISGQDCGDIDIEDNTAITRETTHSLSGGGSFVYLLNSEYTTGNESVKNINIKNNKVKASGSWVYVYQTGDPKFIVEDMVIEGNTLDSLDGGVCERSLSPYYTKGLVIRKNKLKNLGYDGNRLAYVTDFEIIDNKIHLINLDEISDLFYIRNNSAGVGVVVGNELMEGTATNQVRGEPGLVLSRIRTSGNLPDVYKDDFYPSHYGTTTRIPSGYKEVGQRFFDTSIGKEVYWSGNEWIYSGGDGGVSKVKPSYGTDKIQKIIDESRHVIFESGEYEVGELLLHDNLTIDFRGSRILLTKDQPAMTSVLKSDQNKNIKLLNGVIDGNRESNGGNGGAQDGGNHGFSLTGCKNIYMENIDIVNCGTDGLYIGGATNNPSENIYAIDCTFDNNMRQGASIINLIGAKFTNCRFTNSNGKSPQSGVDLEPNNVDQSIEYVSFENCKFTGNSNRGVLIDVWSREYKNISFIRCSMVDNDEEGFRITSRPDSFPTLNRLSINECEIDVLSIQKDISSNVFDISNSYIGYMSTGTGTNFVASGNTSFERVQIVESDHVGRQVFKDCTFDGENSNSSYIFYCNYLVDGELSFERCSFINSKSRIFSSLRDSFFSDCTFKDNITNEILIWPANKVDSNIVFINPVILNNGEVDFIRYPSNITGVKIVNPITDKELPIPPEGNNVINEVKI